MHAYKRIKLKMLLLRKKYFFCEISLICQRPGCILYICSIFGMLTVFYVCLLDAICVKNYISAATHTSISHPDILTFPQKKWYFMLLTQQFQFNCLSSHKIEKKILFFLIYFFSIWFHLPTTIIFVFTITDSYFSSSFLLLFLPYMSFNSYNKQYFSL